MSIRPHHQVTFGTSIVASHPSSEFSAGKLHTLGHSVRGGNAKTVVIRTSSKLTGIQDVGQGLRAAPAATKWVDIKD